MKTQAVATYKLPSGHTLIIDSADAYLLGAYSWHLMNGYVQTEIGSRVYGSRRTIRLHRLIMNPAPNELIDHANCNTLDNRRSNLRVCNKSQNGMNRGAQANSKTGIKGVSWNSQKSRWRAVITVNGKQFHLGFYEQLEDAERAYERGAIKHHKEFARC